MKYNTKETILNEQEKEMFLKNLLKEDRNILKKLYKQYKIDFYNKSSFDIIKIENGFNADYVKENLNGFLYTETYEEKLLKNVWSESFRDFSKYMKTRSIEELRKNKKQVFYTINIKKAPKPRERYIFNYKIDRVENGKTNYLRAWGNVVYGNRFQLEAQAKHYNKKYIIFEVGQEKNINNIIDKSGYIKIAFTEKLKAQAKENAKNKAKEEYNKLDKMALLEKVGKHYKQVKSDLLKYFDFDNIGVAGEMFDGYCFNWCSFKKLYDKINKLNYNNSIDFYADINDFLTANYWKLEDNAKRHEYGGNIWVKNSHNFDENIHISEIANELVFFNDYILYKNKKYCYSGEVLG